MRVAAGRPAPARAAAPVASSSTRARARPPLDDAAGGGARPRRAAQPTRNTGSRLTIGSCEIERDLLAADAAAARSRDSAGQVAAVEDDAARRRSAPVARQQAEDRHRGHRLAAARLADEPDGLARARRRSSRPRRPASARRGESERDGRALRRDSSACARSTYGRAGRARRRAPATGRGAAPAAAASRPALGRRVAHGVAEQAEREHGQRDRDPRRPDQPRLQHDHRDAVGDHPPQLGAGAATSRPRNASPVCTSSDRRREQRR